MYILLLCENYINLHYAELVHSAFQGLLYLTFLSIHSINV